jgi:hypothetical protein
VKRLLPLLALLLAGSTPAGAGTAAWQGVIVAKDPARKAVATASAGGVVRTVRAPARFGALRVGQRLSVHARPLADGTYASTSLRVAGRATRTPLRAVVVRFDGRASRYFVSAGGTTFALQLRSGRALAAAQAVAAPGDQITTTVDVSTGTPQTQQVTQVGHVATIRIEGIVTELGSGTLKLIVAKAGFVTVTIPAGMSLANVKQFDQISLEVAVGTDGSFTLRSARTDQGTAPAGNQGPGREDEDDDDDDEDDDEDEDDDDDEDDEADEDEDDEDDENDDD